MVIVQPDATTLLAFMGLIQNGEAELSYKYWSNGWGGTSDPCATPKWFGVTCNANGRVTAL
jgi:hypothetical protein